MVSQNVLTTKERGILGGLRAKGHNAWHIVDGRKNFVK